MNIPLEKAERKINIVILGKVQILSYGAYLGYRPPGIICVNSGKSLNDSNLSFPSIS